MKTVSTALLCLAITGCAAAPDDNDDNDDAASLVAATGREFDVAALPARLAPGDLVRHGQIAALVPPPGEGVTGEALHRDGTADELTVRTDFDGAVTVTTEASQPPEDLAPVASGKCTDPRYALFDYRWDTTLEWSFKASSTPNQGGQTLPVAWAEDQIRKGGQNIVNAHNDCGRADHVSATINYLGRTTLGVNVTASGTCGTRDGHSVVAFADFNGNAPENLIAATCTYTQQGHGDGRITAVESDIRLQRYNVIYWYTGSCDEFAGDLYFDLQSVMTHERGHSFGLAHAVNSPNLTMYPEIEYCDRGDATLGLGDMLGLEAIY
ncbi:MAG TPA: matrixin family metalloprotease [Kofleriaceae bacterium]|jgi:hypothetical protein